MAIKTTERSRTLQVQVNIGTTQSPKYKKLSFNYLNPNAEDEQIKGLGDKVAACQTYPLNAIINVEKKKMVEEA